MEKDDHLWTIWTERDPSEPSLKPCLYANVRLRMVITLDYSGHAAMAWRFVGAEKDDRLATHPATQMNWILELDNECRQILP